MANKAKSKFKLIDGSGDHNYFTIVPNYIVNHSTPYEQAMYLYMKRKAGETGTCWTSAKEIAKHLGIARNTAGKYRDKLVKRGWIEVVGFKRVGRTMQATPEYKIVDLWELNNQYYAKLKSSKDELFDKKSSTVEQKSSTVAHKEEPIKNQYKNQYGRLVKTSRDTNAVAKVIDAFKIVNPMHTRLFKNTTERSSVESLLKQFTAEQLIGIVQSLPSSNAEQYAPTITTPYELETKLGKLIAYRQKLINAKPKQVTFGRF